MKKLSAFSLVEVSIVILIVGILIAGVSQGKKLLKSSRLSTARNLTQQSPVAEMSDLVAWYETTLDTSFIDSEAQAGVIGTWIDNNTQALKKNNATQSATAKKPLLAKDVFNGSIPAVRFDGTDDFLNFDGTSLVASDYTVFVVEQRRSASTGYFIGGTSIATNTDLILGYRNNTTVTQAQWGNDMDYTVAGYVTPTPVIHTYWLSSVAGKKYWRNGGVAPSASNSSQVAQLVSYSGSNIGNYYNIYYNGDIAEIIIFTRALKIEEKLLIEDYLAKKYNIPTPAGSAVAGTGAGGGSGNIGDASNATYVTCNVSITGVATPTMVNQGTGVLNCNATDYTGTVNYTCNSAGTLTTSNNTCAAAPPHQYWEFIGIYYCTSNMPGNRRESPGSTTVVCDVAHHGKYASMMNLDNAIQPTATNPTWTGISSNTYFWWDCYCNNYDTLICPPCTTINSVLCLAPYGQSVYRCNYN